MTTDCALVTFVKTPRVSPVKTRLARDIGAESALQFYELSLKATEARAKALAELLPSLSIYWAVAEASCLEEALWSQFPRIAQGEGGLGDRLAEVYQQAYSRHPLVCFMGADSPHTSAATIRSHIEKALEERTKRFLIAPTSDGGFYFFAGGISLPAAAWQSVTYSSDRTTLDLIQALKPFAEKTILLSEDFDIDEKADLYRLAELDSSDPDLLSEQKDIILWARALLSC